MKRRIRSVFVMVTAAILIFAVLTGCQERPIGYAAENDVKAELGNDSIEYTYANEVTDSMSESHRVMALMILSNAGMSSDLDDYEYVWLVDIKDSDGHEGKTVVCLEKDETAHQKTIIPDSVKETFSQ